MELFKDKDEELKRLEQLLQQEPEDEEEALEEELNKQTSDDEPEEEVIYLNYSNNYGRVYNSDRTDTDLDAYSDEVYEPKKRRDLLVLTAVALALVGAIMGVLAWWIARYL